MTPSLERSLRHGKLEAEKREALGFTMLCTDASVHVSNFEWAVLSKPEQFCSILRTSIVSVLLAELPAIVQATKLPGTAKL